jgi:hypothetical protein
MRTGAWASIVSTLMVSSLVAGCSAENDQSDKAGLALPQLPSESSGPLAPSPIAYFTAEPCPPDAPSLTVKPGDSFEYIFADTAGAIIEGMGTREVVTTVNGPTVEFEELSLANGEVMGPGDKTSVTHGVVPGRGTPRHYEFSDQDLRKLSGMTEGSQVTLKGEERSQFGRPTTARGDWTVRFIGCGRTTDAVPGAKLEPVRVYRISSFYRSARPEGDVVRLTELERLVSIRSGWKVLNRSSAGAAILSNDDSSSS